MKLLRRDLLSALGAATLAACTSSKQPGTPVATAQPPAPGPKKNKRVLVLGGTGFIGPAIVDAALAGGHVVTMFNRGKSDPGLFPDVETILGDRMTDLDRLKGRDWDAVIDTWAPGPTLVRRAAELLQGRVEQYVYVSTISVYKLGKEPIDERTETLKLPPGTVLAEIKKIDETNYGALKALAEEAAEALMPGRVTSLRPGVIAGPRDPSDRFTYWARRMARGGEVLAPGGPADTMQLIDVRDLGAFVTTSVEAKTFGTYNVLGPADASLGRMLEGVRTAVGKDARLTWVDQAFLDANKVGGWGDFPMCVPAGADDAGFGHVSAARAIAKGLRFRPVGETAQAALAWWSAQPEERRAKKGPGLTPEREAELLALWHKEHG